MAKRKNYSDEEKATYIAMLDSQGYPNILGALKKVSEYSGIPERTLRRWHKRQVGHPPDKVVQHKREELADVFEDVAYKMINHARQPDVIEEMDGKSAVIAAATATDKMRLLRGLPTEIIQVVPEFVRALEKLGQSPVEAMKRIIDRANLESNQNDRYTRH